MTIGGTLGSLAIASATPIFWCWHAFVDHTYYDWQFCQVVVPKWTGVRLGMTKWRLKFAGLKVGSVMTSPFLFVHPEVFSLIREEPIDPGIAKPEMTLMVTVGGHEHGGHGLDASHEATTTFIATAPSKIPGIALLSSLFSGPLVIGKSPAVGATVAYGSSVNLTVLGD